MAEQKEKLLKADKVAHFTLESTPSEKAGKRAFSSYEFGIDFSDMTVQALLDEAWSLRWLCQLDRRLKLTLKSLCSYIWAKKECYI